jgi:hypothetical protein
MTWQIMLNIQIIKSRSCHIRHAIPTWQGKLQTLSEKLKLLFKLVWNLNIIICLSEGLRRVLRTPAEEFGNWKLGFNYVVALKIILITFVTTAYDRITANRPIKAYFIIFMERSLRSWLPKEHTSQPAPSTSIRTATEPEA